MSKRLSWISKISFGLGAFGKDAVYAIVSTFLLYFLTDIKGVAPAFVGTLFLVARIFDAINDPIMGVVVDNTRSKFGKFRPWIMIGTVLNSIVLVFLYLNIDLSGMAYATYIAILYILWGMTYTIEDIPYWSMVPALTDDPNERDQVSSIPRFFASLAWLVVGSGGFTIIGFLGKGDDASGFSKFAMIIAVIFIIASTLTCLKCREAHETPKSAEKVSLKKMVEILVKNDQVLVVLGIAVFFNLGYQLENSFATYYFKYVAGCGEMDGNSGYGGVFRDMIVAKDAEVLYRYGDIFYKDFAAVTRKKYGNGVSYYLGCSIDDKTLDKLIDGILKDNKIATTVSPEGVEIVTRGTGDNKIRFIINHNPEPVTVDGTELAPFGYDISAV